jgi:hypothetical protein
MKCNCFCPDTLFIIQWTACDKKQNYVLSQVTQPVKYINISDMSCSMWCITGGMNCSPLYCNVM